MSYSTNPLVTGVEGDAPSDGVTTNVFGTARPGNSSSSQVSITSKATGTPDVPYTPVFTSIALSGPSELVMTHDGQYTAVAKDQNGHTMTGVTFTYHSSATSKATIDSSSGVATPVAAGSTNITATSGDVTSNTIALTVAAQVATLVVPDPASFSIAVDETQDLTATVYDQAPSPNVIAGASVSWSSLDTDVATVDSDGTVTGVAEGSTTIRATSGSAHGDSDATVEAATFVVLPSSVENAIGDTQQLQVLLNGVDVTDDCTFATDTPSVATVDAPTITSVSPTSLTQGQTSQTVTITGTNFTSAAAGQSVVFDPGTGVTINSTTFVSDTEIDVDVSISGSATTGAGTIQVQDTAHGDSNTKPFTINASVSLIDLGFDFRLSGAGVTDPSDCTAVVVGSNSLNPYPTAQASTVTGVTWTLTGFSTLDNGRLRTPANGILAGCIVQDNNGTQADFAVSGLPAGTYSISFAAGDSDASASPISYITVLDGSTSRIAVHQTTASATNFMDATGVVRTGVAGWNANQAPATGITITSGQTCHVRIGSPTSQSSDSRLAHIRFTQTA